MEADSEEFLSLEDDDAPSPKVKTRAKSPKKEIKLPESITIDADIIDMEVLGEYGGTHSVCLLYTSPSPRDATLSRMPSSA